MYCSECGRWINDDAPFCIYCGCRTAVIQITEREDRPVQSKHVDPPNPLKRLVFILIAVAVIMSLALGYIVFTNRQMSYLPFHSDDILSEENMFYIKNELIVTLKEGAKRSELQSLIKEEGGDIVGYIPIAEKYQIKLTDDTELDDLKDIADSLSNQDIVENATLHYVYKLSQSAIDYMEDPWNNSSQGDENSEGNEWTIKQAKGNNWWAEAIGMQSLWAQKSEFKSVKVGICDVMFDASNKDIKSSITKTWNNPDEEDQESTVEQYKRYEALSDEEKKAYKGFNNGHGTHLSGIIGAEQGNDYGITGIMSNPKLYCYSLSAANDQIEEAWGDSFEIQSAIVRMILKDVRIIDLPLSFSQISTAAENGDEYSIKTIHDLQTDYEAFFKRLLKAGKDFLIVKSAGNSTDSSVNPRDAKYDFIGGIENEIIKKHIIVVGAASNHEDYFTRADFSYAGDSVDVFAPGKYILSVLPDNNTGVLSGTSEASAITAGVAGLVWGTNSHLKSEDVKNILVKSVRWTTARENTLAGSTDHPDRSVPIINAFNSVTMAKAYEVSKGNANIHKGVITGFVYSEKEDADDIHPIENVVITATSPSGDVIQTKNGNAVNYALYLDPGQYSISIHKKGYEDITFTIEAKENQLICFDAQMKKTES